MTRLSCFYGGVAVETLEVPAWKTRLRALRTVLAMASAEEVEKNRIKIPFGAVTPGQLATITEGLYETDLRWMTAEFLVAECLMPLADAVKTGFLFYRGRLVDSLRIRDWGTQLEAVKIGLRIHRAYPSERDNIHFVTYRDIALLACVADQKTQVVQLSRQTQLVQVR